jgi:2-polyprenyl-3-methyl-5-hydroxy-6-metoxy-1,4-benzoquinol methylase
VPEGLTGKAPAEEWPLAQLERVPSCPICGATTRSVLHEGLEDRIFFAAPGRWRLERCGSCGCAYLDPRPTRASIGAAYRRYFPRSAELDSAPPTAYWREALWNGYLNQRYGYSFRPASRLGAFVLPLFRKRRWNAALTIRELAKPPGRPRLLDVGFGDGSFLRFMSAAGWQVSGIEADPKAVEAGQASGLDVTRGDLEDPPYDAGAFDAITLSHVLEHLHDPTAALASCGRLLRPEGVLWLATPNLDSPGHRRFGASWFGLDPPRHLVLFNRSALGRALAMAGFAVGRWARAYRAELVLAGSEALAAGGDAAAARAPDSARLRRLARVYDVGAALRPAWGEELVALARKAR